MLLIISVTLLNIKILIMIINMVLNMTITMTVITTEKLVIIILLSS